VQVFLTNVRRRGLRRLGLEWEQVQERYPRLVYCHLTGWGREGPLADKAGYDIGRSVMQLATIAALHDCANSCPTSV
jgi:crotonobetainyl-CoA:carnitine CoA-transferase CaiB-like acyl-CoA transferase